MAHFKDAGGREWGITFDAFLLADIRKELDIDLADVASGGWLKVETDSVVLSQVVAIACRDEIKQRGLTPREFIKGIRGQVIEAARKSLADEGADFFPQSEWSAIRLNCSTRREAKTQAEKMAAALEAVQGMGPDFRAGAMEAMMDIARQAAREGMSSGDSQPENQSASGPDDTRSKNAISERESAALTAAG